MSSPTPITQPPPVGDEPDPFVSLHKMSTTAGLGSADYVAINGLALATVLLGIASSIALFGGNILLLLPLAALVCGVLALVQIGHSNGTQTGRFLASIGMLLALVFGGYMLGSEVYTASSNRGNRNQILQVIAQFSNDIKTDDFNKAYQLTNSDFQSKVSPEIFADRFKAANAVPVLGHIEKIQWNQHMAFGADPVSNDTIATTYLKMTYAKAASSERTPAVFRQQGTTWLISALPDIFPPPTGPQRGQATAKPKGVAEPEGPPAPK